jgi:hypothetical protein
MLRHHEHQGNFFFVMLQYYFGSKFIACWQGSASFVQDNVTGLVKCRQYFDKIYFESSERLFELNELLVGYIFFGSKLFK